MLQKISRPIHITDWESQTKLVHNESPWVFVREKQINHLNQVA